MEIRSIVEEKKKFSNIIKETYGFLKKVKPIWLVMINELEEEAKKDLLEALKILPSNFIVMWEWDNEEAKNITFVTELPENLEVGIDFVILTDKEKEIYNLTEKGVTPIISKENSFEENTIKEFNPMQSEGNGYIFEKNNKWEIFYSLTKYLENYKFPYDNRNLVKNVLEIKAN